jgi:hypothetical protein
LRGWLLWLTGPALRRLLLPLACRRLWLGWTFLRGRRRRLLARAFLRGGRLPRTLRLLRRGPLRGFAPLLCCRSLLRGRSGLPLSGGRLLLALLRRGALLRGRGWLSLRCGLLSLPRCFAGPARPARLVLRLFRRLRLRNDQSIGYNRCGLLIGED